jgi:hypothetical protein
VSGSANSASAGNADVDAGGYLVLAPGFVVESLDDRQVTIYLQGVGTRLRLPKALHAALMRPGVRWTSCARAVSWSHRGHRLPHGC